MGQGLSEAEAVCEASRDMSSGVASLGSDSGTAVCVTQLTETVFATISSCVNGATAALSSWGYWKDQIS